MINARAMGLVFPNIHDQNMPELVVHRAVASTPFAGRYRLIDFTLSGMSNAGIRNIGVIARQNYQSLMDHLGNGREWDLSHKNGGLILFPPYARGGEVYRGRVAGVASVLEYLEHRREDLVVMSDCDIACNMDINHLLSRHMDSGADVTLAYERVAINEGMAKDNMVLRMDKSGRVTELRLNDYRSGVHCLSMNVYVMGREFLINAVREATVRGDKDFERDVLSRHLKGIRVSGYEFEGYRARIYGMQSYFRENLRLLSGDNLAALFPPERPVYTKVRDEAPVRYAIGSHVANCLVADGCLVEGDIESCVLFRGVHVGKGARLRHCVIMQGTEIAEDVLMENVITDKDVTVAAGQKLRGSGSYPVFIAKGSRVG